MRRSKERNGEVCYEEVKFWWDGPRGTIHLVIAGLPAGEVTISNDPSRPDGHPMLYRRLGACLNRLGAPGPFNDSNPAAVDFAIATKELEENAP